MAEARYLRPLRLACLGGGTRSAVGRAHMAALAMDRLFEIVAGCFSPSDEENCESADSYCVAKDRCYRDLATMLTSERGRVDAYLILTPTDQHSDHVLQCLRAGENVICEKALAGTSSEIRAIREVESVSDGLLAVTYNYLGYPMVRELRAMIAAGEFGTLKQILVEMPQEGFLRRRDDGAPMAPQSWRLRDGRVPTLSLDLGVHLHSLVKFLTDRVPVRVVAVQSSFGNFPGLIDNTVAITRYNDDLLSTAWFAKSALGHRNGLKVRVYGDKAGAEWVQEAPELLHFADSFGDRRVIDRGGRAMRIAQAARYSRFKAGHPAGFNEAFANYYEDVADVLHARLSGYKKANPYVFGSELALEGALWLEALSRSAEMMAWVDI